MNLPTELRLDVYEYAFSSPKDVTLRSPKDLEVRKGRHGQRVRSPISPGIGNISLLIASRRVFTEAIPIFYYMNRFHYTILPTVPSVQGVLRHFLMHLHLMQHISIDYMLHASASDISEADRLVSTRIQSVTNGCPNLRTFTLHLLTFFQNYDLHRNLSSDSRTALELSRLAARLPDATNRLESISIVTHGHDLFLTDLLDGIAPRSCWTVCRPLEWPDISIDEHQKEGMERREDGVVCQQTWRYYLWPAMRKPLEGRRERASAATKR